MRIYVLHSVIIHSDMNDRVPYRLQNSDDGGTGIDAEHGLFRNLDALMINTSYPVALQQS